MDVQLTLVIPAALHAQGEALARRLGLTRSALYAEALADFLDLHGESASRPD
jgi:predicted transcriptional regulator